MRKLPCRHERREAAHAQLVAQVEHRARVGDDGDRAAAGERRPGRGGALREPRGRGGDEHDAGAHGWRRKAEQRHVERGDDDRGDGCEATTDPRHGGEELDRGGDDPHVQPGDGERVHEPGVRESLTERRVQPAGVGHEERGGEGVVGREDPRDGRPDPGAEPVHPPRPLDRRGEPRPHHAPRGQAGRAHDGPLDLHDLPLRRLARAHREPEAHVATRAVGDDCASVDAGRCVLLQPYEPPGAVERVLAAGVLAPSSPCADHQPRQVQGEERRQRGPPLAEEDEGDEGQDAGAAEDPAAQELGGQGHQPAEREDEPRGVCEDGSGGERHRPPGCGADAAGTKRKERAAVRTAARSFSVSPTIRYPAIGSARRSFTTAPVKVEPVVPVSSTSR